MAATFTETSSTTVALADEAGASLGTLTIVQAPFAGAVTTTSAAIDSPTEFKGQLTPPNGVEGPATVFSQKKLKIALGLTPPVPPIDHNPQLPGFPG